MDQLRQAIQEAMREAERLGQPEPPPTRRVVYPLEQPRPVPIDYEGQDAEAGVQRAKRAKEALTPPVASAPAPIAPNDIRAILGSRAALRQAFFLREILGPPRALQGPDGDGRI
jgi:hypothetical protein